MMGSQAKSVRVVLQNFRRDAEVVVIGRRLSYNDEQIHKFDRCRDRSPTYLKEIDVK